MAGHKARHMHDVFSSLCSFSASSLASDTTLVSAYCPKEHSGTSTGQLHKEGRTPQSKTSTATPQHKPLRQQQQLQLSAQAAAKPLLSCSNEDSCLSTHKTHWPLHAYIPLALPRDTHSMCNTCGQAGTAPQLRPAPALRHGYKHPPINQRSHHKPTGATLLCTPAPLSTLHHLTAACATQ